MLCVVPISNFFSRYFQTDDSSIKSPGDAKLRAWNCLCRRWNKGSLENAIFRTLMYARGGFFLGNRKVINRQVSNFLLDIVNWKYGRLDFLRVWNIWSRLACEESSNREIGALDISAVKNSKEKSIDFISRKYNPLLGQKEGAIIRCKGWEAIQVVDCLIRESGNWTMSAMKQSELFISS